MARPPKVTYIDRKAHTIAKWLGHPLCASIPIDAAPPLSFLPSKNGKILLFFKGKVMGQIYLSLLEREPVVDYPTFLWSDYPTDYPISDTRPPIVPSVG